MLGSPQEFGPIEVWPLLTAQQRVRGWGSGLEYLEVGEALEPDPNTLHVTNEGTQPVFLPMGFLIQGLQQSRMVAEDLLIPEETSIDVPVLCVEAGRFSDLQPPRAAGRAPVSVMAAGSWMAAPQDRQGSVWTSVSKQERRTGQRPTSSLAQVMTEDSRTEQLQTRVHEAVTARLEIESNQVGVVATAGGEPILMEMFGSPDLARAYVPDLIRGMAFDVDGYDPFPSTAARVLDFLNDARAVKFACAPQPSGATKIHGAHGRVQLHGIWFGARTYVHVMATNSRHPILMGV